MEIKRPEDFLILSLLKQCFCNFPVSGGINLIIWSSVSEVGPLESLFSFIFFFFQPKVQIEKHAWVT